MSDITTAPTDSIPATIAVPISVPTVFVSTALANVSSAASSFLSSSINASASTTSTSASSSPTSNSNPFFPDFSGNYSNVPGTVVSSAQNQSGLQTQLLVCGGVGLICFLVFCYLRPRWTEMFAPRLNMKRHKPPELPNSFFGWIIPLIKVDEQELLQTVGLDAVVMLQFFVMAIKLFGICSFFGIVTLIPISVTTGNTTSFETENVTNGGLDRLAITVLDDSSDYLVAYLIYTYLFCLLTFFFLYRNYRTFVGLRAAYLIRLSKTLTNRSVMVTGIPRNLRTDEKLAEYYEHLGIGHVERSHIVRHVSELRSLLSKRTSALRNLEKAYVNYWGNPCRIPGYDPDEILTDARLFQAVAQRRMQMEQEKADENNTFLLGLMEDTPLRGRKSTHSSRPQIRLGFLGLWGKKVDAIDHYTKEFDLYDRKVLEARNSTQFEMTSVGFVTFENMSSALIAAQIAIHPEPFACRTVIAYEPRDVLWQNVTIGGRERLVREIFVWAITIALSLFWIFPISIFSSLTSMKALERVVPGLVVAAEKNDILHNLLQGTLPTLAVQIFMAVLPLIFDALGIVQGQRARSDIAEATFSKYFFFLLFNVLLVFTLVSTIFKTIEQIVNHPAEVLNMLSTSLPAVAPFFINYTILQGMLLQPLSLLLLGALIIRGFSYLFLCKTPRDYAENRAPWTFNYGVGYPPPLLIFIIVLVYSTISPIILLFGTIYFCIAYLVYKYQFLYVYFQPYDALGSAWPMVFPRIIVGMIIFQLTMTGLFVLKKAITLGVLCVPLIVMTIIYKIVMDLAFRKNSQCLPMQLLRDEMTKMPLKKGDTTQLSSDDDDDDEDDDKDDTDKEDDSSNAYKQASDDSQKKLEPIQEEKSNESSTSGSVKDRWKKAAAMALTQTGQSMMSLRSTDVKPKKRRRVVLDEDDYEAIPDNRTDYRQPPMMLNPGVLDTGFKKFGNPYIIGILPQLWLPVKSNEGSCNANIPLDRSKRVTSKHPGDASGSVANELAQLLRRVESMRRQSIRRVTKKKESNEPLSSPPSSSAPVEQDSSSPSSNVSLLRRVFRHSSSAVHAGGQQPSSSRNSNTRPASISQQPINRDSSDQEQTSRQDSGDDSTTSSLTIQKELDRSNIPIW